MKWDMMNIFDWLCVGCCKQEYVVFISYACQDISYEKEWILIFSRVET